MPPPMVRLTMPAARPTTPIARMSDDSRAAAGAPTGPYTTLPPRAQRGPGDEERRMIRWSYVVGMISVLVIPAVAHPQGLEIDHKAVGCIVAGKFPKMSACFTPASSLARGRVYFRPEGTARWYYVEMKADQSCYAGVLPKPSKTLVGKKIEYYLEGQDRTFSAASTAEYGPVVVRSALECKKTVPIAPFLNNATVAVVPGVPAGFATAGAIGSVAAIAITGAGLAAAGTAAAVVA